MVVYMDLALVLNFAVDLCLLLGAERLTGHKPNWKRALTAAGLGSAYAAVCLLPEFRFLGNILLRISVLCIMSVIAFGWGRSSLRRGVVFVLLSMALGGIALGIGKKGFWGLIASAGLICILCFVGFPEPVGQSRYVQVVLHYRNRCMTVTALVDTGNLLRDPLTGESVLLLGADVAANLLGLHWSQLQNPIETVRNGTLPGARLIPYRSVGRENGMLLAMKLDSVQIDGRELGRLVAFAPEILCKGKSYQALTGGVL